MRKSGFILTSILLARLSIPSVPLCSSNPHTGEASVQAFQQQAGLAHCLWIVWERQIVVKSPYTYSQEKAL